MTNVIQVELADRVATITLNRPEVRNAINLEMVEALHNALGGLADRSDCHALVIRGAGGKAFASGADIAELRNRRADDAMKGINGSLFARVEAFPRPTIAQISGVALGGGLELALACDFRIAGESSKFGQPEVTLGIMAAAGGTRRLPALVGLSHARWLLFSGGIITAADALRIGLVDRMVLDVALPQAVRDHLAPILSAAPEAVRQTKEALRRWSHNATDDELARFDREAQSKLFEHPEKFARMDAFLAKRARPK